MKLETAHKRLVYEESIWPVKEMELMEENRKLHLRIGILRLTGFELMRALLERDVEGTEKELVEWHAKLNQTHVLHFCILVLWTLGKVRIGSI